MDSHGQTSDKNEANIGAPNPAEVDTGLSPEEEFVPLHYNGINYNMLTEEYMLGKKFKSIEEAELFYYSYAKCMGFDVRKQDIKHGKGERISMRRYVCSKQGVRNEKWLNAPVSTKRSRKAITRENCNAAFKISYRKNTDSYHVTEFTPKHSHPHLSSMEAIFLPSHRHVPETNLAIAKEMRKASVRTCHIYDFLLHEAGGYNKVGFTIKDLYNEMAKATGKAVKEGDIEAAFFYLQAKATMDPNFFCKFSVDEENKLVNLFWRDGTSVVEYSCFGDILMFDSTYKTNRYGKPLVFFVGVNNHRGNVLFASAFLANETAKCYKWVLETFLCAMNNKKPISVLTDGDEAMQTAIDEVLPGSHHRFCAWHIGRNAKHHLHLANRISKFKECMYEPMSPVQFEHLWQELVGNIPPGQDGNLLDWLKMMYAKKEKWSNAFLAGHFFGGIQSTQRVESVHHCMKDFLRRNHMTIYECLPQLDKGVMRLRHKRALADSKASSSTPALCTELRELEQHAAIIYTEGAFARVIAQIKLVGGLKCKAPVDFGHCMYYTISKYGDVGGEWVVFVRQEGVIRYECPCRLFESEGIPCSHIFCTLKEADLKKIPEVLIKRRWTKDAAVGVEILNTSDMIYAHDTQAAMYGALSSLCSRLCLYGSHTTDGFNMVKSELTRVTAAAEVIWDKHRATCLTPGRHDNKRPIDPEIVKSKHKLPTDPAECVNLKANPCKCSGCHEVGHAKRSCNQLESARTYLGEEHEHDDFDLGVYANDGEDGPRDSIVSPSMEQFDSLSLPTSDDYLFRTNEGAAAPYFHSQPSQSNPPWHIPGFNF